MLKKQWIMGIVSVGLLALWGSACGKERPALNRVQPNYHSKSFFKSEWYYQQTVVDVPASETFTFVGDTDHSGLKRVTWEDQEKFLYARRSHELIEGADDKQRTEEAGGVYSGEPMAVFRIESHFDIIQDYNTSTGELMNSVREDSVERPWHEREYIRVDWSKNLVTNPGYSWEVEGAEPVSYYVQEIDPLSGERHPHAPTFEDDYFDVTTKMIARAGTYEYPGYGVIPLCWFWDHSFMECGASEYTIRHSFKKIDPKWHYEAVPHKGGETELFGYFTTERMTYDPQTGIRQQSKVQWLNRHNIWEQPYKDAQGNFFPYAERRGKPVVYHVNRDWPEADVALNNAAQTVAAQWNTVFVDAVNAVGAALPEDEQMFVLCPHNPVQEGDHPLCGGVGNSPRLGDLRYSFIAYVPSYMEYGLLGLGPSNNDPITGEIISGMGYVYHHNDTAAWDVVEMVELLAGTRAPDSYIDGVDLSDWVDGVLDSQANRQNETMSMHGHEHVVKQMANNRSVKNREGRRYDIPPEDEREQIEDGVGEWLKPFEERAAMAGQMKRNDGVFAARANQLKGTEIEGLMINDELMMGLGIDPATPVSDTLLENVSPLRDSFNLNREILQDAFEAYAAERTMYLAQMADNALIGLARKLAESAYTSQEIYQIVREKIYTAVLAHEVGHSLGLMHNFGGSDDAINYHDDYWELRKADESVCPRVDIAPITDYELDNGIYEYSYSSVMDYAGRMTIDGAGLGKYDRAAVLVGYVRKVEAYEEGGGAVEAAPETVGGQNMLNEWAEGDGDVVFFWNRGPQSYHYTWYYEKMGDLLWQEDNRVLVDVDSLSDDYGKVDSGEHANKFRVPYVYCSHGRANLGDNCLTRDYGADSAERMQHITQSLDTWYITRSFPRGKMGKGSLWWNYVSRGLGRTYNRLKDWGDIYGLYGEFLGLFYDAEVLEAFFGDVEKGWGVQTWGVTQAFQKLMETVLMPNVASYDLETDWEGNQMLREASRGPVTLGVEQARYYSTDWSRGGGERECGYFWYDCLHHFGWYLDKMMAIHTLVRSDTYFVGRATPEDVREWLVGYYGTFTEQMLKVNYALMSEDWSKVGPYVDAEGTLKWPDYTGPLNVDVATLGTPVDPFATFTVQMFWQVLGQMGWWDGWSEHSFNADFSNGFALQSNIRIKTAGNAARFGTAPTVEFRDPVSGLTYFARRYSVVNGGKKSAAEAMLDRANRMYQRSSYCQGLNCVEPAGGWSKAAVSTEMAKYTQLIAIVSQMSHQYTHGDPFSP